jgi:hypothetical protein
MAEKETILLSRWDGGENTEDTSDNLGINESPVSENANPGRGGSIRKEDGTIELGEDGDAETPACLIVAPNREGDNFLFKFSGTNLKIYDSVNEVWPAIKTGLTAGIRWGHDTADNVLILASQVDTAMSLDLAGITRLDGAILDDAAEIDVVDASGLSASGTIYINGVAVVYTGITTNQLTGCLGAVETPDNYLAVQALSDETDIPKGNLVINYGGRLVVAGVIGSGGATIYTSKASNRTDFTIAGSGSDDAVAESLYAKINAIRVFYNDDYEEVVMVFCADNNIYNFSILDDITLGTLASLVLFKQNVTAINQFSTLVSPNDIYHIDLDNQVRTLGPRTDDGSGRNFSDSISAKRKSDFRDNYDFSDASAAIANGEYWLNCKKGGGDDNNRFVIYDLAKNAWRSRVGISASDVVNYNNRITIALASENKVVQITPNTLNDIGEPIYFKHSTLDMDSHPMVFERLQAIKIIGKMSQAAVLSLYVKRDFGNIQIGSFAIAGNNENITGEINGASSGGEFGTVAFGTEPIGSGSGSDERFFIAMLSMETMPDFENFRIEFENNQADVYIEIFKVKPIYGQVMKEGYFPQNYIIKNNNVL